LKMYDMKIFENTKHLSEIDPYPLAHLTQRGADRTFRPRG
jgi:hypothetical protein